MFSAATILILTLALALNATTFRVMDATLFHGFPLVQQNDRLLFIDERFPTPACCVSYTDFEASRAEASSFEDMAFGIFNLATVSEHADEARDVYVGETTANSAAAINVRSAAALRCWRTFARPARAAPDRRCGARPSLERHRDPLEPCGRRR